MQIKNILKWLVTFTVIGLIVWFFYDFHFKYVINEYQAKKIEKRLQDNFYNNQNSFKEILTFSKQFSKLENLEFKENGLVRFQVYDNSLDRTNYDPNFIIIGENSIFEVLDINFLENNDFEVILEDTVLSLENWIIDFEGKMSDPLIKKLLSYNEISLDQLQQLNKKLNQINCHGFDKNDNLITIRFIGHWGESFNYLIPLTDQTKRVVWNKLSDNYYWEHYRNPLFCDWTDW